MTICSKLVDLYLDKKENIYKKHRNRREHSQTVNGTEPIFSRKMESEIQTNSNRLLVHRYVYGVLGHPPRFQSICRRLHLDALSFKAKSQRVDFDFLLREIIAEDEVSCVKPSTMVPF